MTERPHFVSTIAFFSAAACGDDGTLLGSMASRALAQLSSMSGCANCVPSPCIPPTGQCSADGSDVLRCR